MPKFSVIVPLYNKENYIAKTLKAILDQTFSDFEIILINDGSTDKSKAIVQEFQDVRINYYEQENKGLSATRNIGINYASAEIIALCDADDVWLPQHLEHLQLLAETYPEASLYGTDWEMQLKHKNINVGHSFSSSQPHVLIDDFFRANLAHPLVCPSALAFKKEVILTVGDFNPKVDVGEDTDFLIRANLAYQFAYHQTPTCLYALVSENQITTSILGDKSIPNFDFYENKNPEFKFFFDFQRYTYALKYKQENNQAKFKALLKKIEMKNLNNVQRLLLKMPTPAYTFIKKLKERFLSLNILINSH